MAPKKYLLTYERHNDTDEGLWVLVIECMLQRLNDAAPNPTSVVMWLTKIKPDVGVLALQLRILIILHDLVSIV